jgi:hypothetical protein
MPIMPTQQTDHLRNLSPDLKLAIFTRLCSLDDYFRMAETSKEMGAFLWSNKIFVIRGIIVSIGQAEWDQPTNSSSYRSTHPLVFTISSPTGLKRFIRLSPATTILS